MRKSKRDDELGTAGGGESGDLVQRILQIERATLSGIVSTLVGKGLIQQSPDPDDQRQKLLRLTPVGHALWAELPDPIAIGRTIAFAGVDDADLSRAALLLEAATRRLHEHLKERAEP